MAIPVKARELGFYGGKLRYEGDEFSVRNAQELGTWMERQDGGPNRGEEEVVEVSAPTTPQAPAAPAPTRRGAKSTPQAPAAPADDPQDESGANPADQDPLA